MKEVMIEADDFDDIIWPSTCVSCAKEIELQDSKKINMVGNGLFESNYESPATIFLNVCNKCISNRVHKQAKWLHGCLIALASFILMLFVAIVLLPSQSAPIYEDSDAWAGLFFFLAVICFLIIIVSWNYWYESKESNYYKRFFRCIHQSKTEWLFKIANDVFADQLIESDKSRQAKEQRQQEESRREQQAQEPQIGTKNGLAIASLVLGILGSSFSILFGIAAVICGHIARHNIENEPRKYGGNGMAIAGLILGYISIALNIVIVLVIGKMNEIIYLNIIELMLSGKLPT